MNNSGLNTYQQYPQVYSVPQADPSKSAVNIVINAAQPPAMPYYYPQYYPYPYYIPQTMPVQQQTVPVQQVTPQKPEPAPAKAEEPQEPPKPVLTDEVYNEINKGLNGDRDERLHAIAKAMNYIDGNENDPRMTGLINTALHPNQPGPVREAAKIAAASIRGDETTKALASMPISMPGERLDVVVE